MQIKFQGIQWIKVRETEDVIAIGTFNRIAWYFVGTNLKFEGIAQISFCLSDS